MLITLLTFAPLYFSRKTNIGYLYPQFYYRSFPHAVQIVKSIISNDVAKDTRMAASLPRLHFHDWFVKIKSTLERECPQTVSCADIMALAARDSTVLTGGPSWEVSLGRKDSRVVVLPKAIYLVSEIFTLRVTCSGKAAYEMMKQMAGNPTKWEGRRVLFIHTGRLPCTCMARSGKLDPVIGRDDEIRRCIQILSRRTKNNHVLKYRNWS
ncbi:hypothetical protein AgCh_026590 [Apium graveolens]